MPALRSKDCATKNVAPTPMRKYGKVNGNCQTAQEMRNLTTEHRDAEVTTATITASKSKIEEKKEGINRNLLSSHGIEKNTQTKD